MVDQLIVGEIPFSLAGKASVIDIQAPVSSSVLVNASTEIAQELMRVESAEVGNDSILLAVSNLSLTGAVVLSGVAGSVSLVDANGTAYTNSEAFVYFSEDERGNVMVDSSVYRFDAVSNIDLDLITLMGSYATLYHGPWETSVRIQ